jgi:hypothetical protein
MKPIIYKTFGKQINFLNAEINFQKCFIFKNNLHTQLSKEIF